MTDELKPLLSCPFCGSSDDNLAIMFTGYQDSPDITIDYYVHCFGCGAESGKNYNAKYAIKAWNRRREDAE